MSSKPTRPRRRTGVPTVLMMDEGWLFQMDEDVERRWGHAWIQDLLANEGYVLTPDEHDQLRTGLDALAQAPEGSRTLADLAALVPHTMLRTVLRPYTVGARCDADEVT